MAKKFSLSRKHADKHVLYQLAVQEPSFEVDFALKQYRKRRGKLPQILREDFCGTAAISCRWAEENKDFRAIGLDLDPPTLAWAHANNLKNLGDARNRVDLRCRDVRSITNPKADVIQAFNFSYYLIYPVSDLISYFRCVRRSLAPGGIFMLDGYGGWESQQVLRERRTVNTPKGTFGFIWDQAAFNPITNQALCHIHFEFKNGKTWKRVFTYDWRVYSPVEVRDALHTAGFDNIEIFWDMDDDDDTSDYRPKTKVANCAGWLTYIVAEAKSNGK